MTENILITGRKIRKFCTTKFSDLLKTQLSHIAKAKRLNSMIFSLFKKREKRLFNGFQTDENLKD